MPGSHDWRNRAASQIAQQLPDNTADVLTVLHPRAVDRHIWPKAEYDRALDLINRGYDKLIVAVCGREQQIERAMARDGITREEVLERLNRQMPLEEKLRFADYVIDTSGTKEETSKQVKAVYDSLMDLAKQI